MAQIGTLTNRTRSAQRPPLIPPQVNAERLALLLNISREARPGFEPTARHARQEPAGGSKKSDNPPPEKERAAKPPASAFLHGQRNSHRPASQSPLYKPMYIPPQVSRQPAHPPAHPPAKPPLPQIPIVQEPLETSSAIKPEKPAGDPPAETAPLPLTPPEPAPPKREPPTASSHNSLSLPQLIARHPDLPPQAAVLGVSDDGLPVVFDLADPAPGAIAIIGDERNLQLALLRAAVASLAARNTPRGVQMLVISHQPGDWQAWISERGYGRFFLAVLGVDSPAVHEWALRLADWTEQRRLGQSSGPPVLVVIDSLRFLNRLPNDVRLNFQWLLKEGPIAQIWPMAALSTDRARTVDPSLMAGFHTRLLGYAREPEAYIPLTGMDEADIEGFRQPGRFGVQIGQDWLRFRPLDSID